MPWFRLEAVFEASREEIQEIVSEIRDEILGIERAVSVSAVPIPDDDPSIPRRTSDSEGSNP